MKNLMRRLGEMRWQRPLSLLTLLLFAGLGPAAFGGDDDSGGHRDGDGGGDAFSGGDETIGTLPSRNRGRDGGNQQEWQGLLNDGRFLTIEGTGTAIFNTIASMRADSFEVTDLLDGRQRMTLRGDFELALHTDLLAVSDLHITVESLTTASTEVRWRSRVVSGLSLSPVHGLELPLAGLGSSAGGLQVTSVDGFGIGSNLSVRAGRERLILTQRQLELH